MFSLVNFWDHNKNICLGPPILPLPKKKFIGYFWPLVSYILKLSIQPYIDQTLNPLALTIHPSTHRRNWIYKPFWKNPTGHPSHLCWNPGWTNPAGWSCWNDLATPKKLKVELFFFPQKNGLYFSFGIVNWFNLITKNKFIRHMKNFQSLNSENGHFFTWNNFSHWILRMDIFFAKIVDTQTW